jgi:hypothetical protein
MVGYGETVESRAEKREGKVKRLKKGKGVGDRAKRHPPK